MISVHTASRCATAFVAGLVAALLHVPSAAAEPGGPALPPIGVEPIERKFDWVQLESGEWLKGELTRMYDDKLYFESDEFDNVSVDWGDVATLVPAGPVTVRLPNRRTVTGDFEMHNSVITIVDAEGQIVQAMRADVTSLIVGEQDELGYWSGGASVGLSARSGNAKQVDLNLRAEIMRQTTLTRSKLSYTGAISSSANDSVSPSVTTANSHRVPATFDVFLTDRFFLTPFSFEYFTDEFQNIGSRFTVGMGLGYDIYSNHFVTWEVGGGAAYQNTTFQESTTPGSDNDAAIVFNTVIDFDLPRGIEWDNEYMVQVVVTDLGKTSHHAVSELSFDIWGPLELEAAFIFDRVETPEQKPSGPPVVSNDYRLTLGLGIEY